MVVALDRLLVLNPKAGGHSNLDEQSLRRQLRDYEVVNLEEGQDLSTVIREAGLKDDATVVVAGGDGTVAAAARALAGSARTLGIIPAGTFNNFARSLGIPTVATAALRALQAAKPSPVSLGRVNGRPFLEAASFGLFGDLINLGEAAKELRYGELLDRIQDLSSPTFRYRLRGDLDETGTARAFVVANTPSTGALVQVGSVTPEEPVLELTVVSATRPGALLRRLTARLVPGGRRPRTGRLVRRLRIETVPAISVYADAEQVGETPAEVLIEPDALNVLLPG